MESWIIVLVVLAGAALVLVLLMGSKRQAKLEVVAKRLMTERERQAIGLIEESFPGARVHSQVAMAALLQTRPGLARAQRTALRNRFDRKIVDFVVEERATGDVLAIVELDDRTHNATKDKARDAMTAAAGYRTIRIPAGTKLTFENVTSILRDAPPSLTA